ncbi:hypothetical protein M3600_20015 [Niallia sp. MER 6]|nr:hypothetical protein [Niallia sp. MER 6]MCM3032796.1 hypothetical protein [Niallia sp. MER 6]
MKDIELLPAKGGINLDNSSRLISVIKRYRQLKKLAINVPIGTPNTNETVNPVITVTIALPCFSGRLIFAA